MATQKYQLVMRTGPNPGQIFELNKAEIYVGRDASNDIPINDAEVSRKHARLILQSGGYVLEDLGSTNGTFVNNQRLLGPHMLRSGESIMFGENVSLTIEPAYDENATMVSQPPPPPVYAPPPPPRPRPQAEPRRAAPPPPPPQPVYSPPPPQYDSEPSMLEKKKNNSLIFAGCGCLLIILCLLVGLIAFDAMNMYCVGPFRALSPLYEMIRGGVCP